MSGRTTIRFAAVAVSLSVIGLAHAKPPEGFTLMFSDEFDGTTVNESAWAYRLGRRGGEDPAAGWINALNRQENVTISGGMMRIRHAQEMVDGKLENTCGGLISRRRFGYGYYETRYKPLMIKSRGTHGAFWQRGLGKTSDPAEDPTRAQFNTIFEIDGSELSSPSWKGTNNLYLQVHSKQSADLWTHRCTVPVKPDGEGFVVDAWEYSPDGIVFYDNGREVGRTSFNQLTAQQEVWLTSLAGAHWQQMDASLLRGEALFDYFRYYTKDYPGVNLLANGGFEYNFDTRDRQTPVAWLELGDVKASAVIGDLGDSVLRHEGTTPYSVRTEQTLQHILDGQYQVKARVRSSGGQKVAKMVVRSGQTTMERDIPASTDWVGLDAGMVGVQGGTVTVGLISEVATSGQQVWMEVDDVVLMKPGPMHATAGKIKTFDPSTDPRYAMFDGYMQSFADGRHYLFERVTGCGEAISVAAKLRVEALKREVPIEKTPASGEAGWKVRITPGGDVEFVIGSEGANTVVAARAVLHAGETKHIACVFDRGDARIYADGKLVKQQSGIVHRTDDKSAPGTLGVRWGTASQQSSYSGELGNLRIFNRAITEEEIVGLAQE